MKSITVRKHVGADGILQLRVPTGLSNVELEVMVIVQPLANGTPKEEPERDAHGWPVGFFERTFGSIPDLPERAPQGEFEEREPLQ